MVRIRIAERASNDARECGDACGYWERDGKLVLCVADSLGHGAEAEKAADAALSGTLTCGGIGNVRIATGRAGANLLRNSDGIVGAGYQRLAIEEVRLWPGNPVVMYTDGLKSDIALGRYDRTGLADPRRLAEMVLHDWRRGTDDAAVLIFRYEAP